MGYNGVNKKPKGVFQMSVKDSWKKVGTDLNDIGEDITSSDLGKDMLKFGKDLGKSVVKTVKAGIKAVADWADGDDVEDAEGEVVDAVENAAEAVKNAAEEVADQAEVIYAEAAETVEEAVEEVGEKVEQAAECVCDEKNDQ